MGTSIYTTGGDLPFGVLRLKNPRSVACFFFLPPPTSVELERLALDADGARLRFFEDDDSDEEEEFCFT